MHKVKRQFGHQHSINFRSDLVKTLVLTCVPTSTDVQSTASFRHARCTKRRTTLTIGILSAPLSMKNFLSDFRKGACQRRVFQLPQTCSPQLRSDMPDAQREEPLWQSAFCRHCCSMKNFLSDFRKDACQRRVFQLPQTCSQQHRSDMPREK